MIIAHISDTHIDLDNPNTAARLGDFERCVATINRLDPLPDVVVHTGDLTHYGKPSEYQACRHILNMLRCPYHVAVGNRDDRAALRAAFPADCYLLPGTLFMQYSVDDFPVRLIIADTQNQNGGQGDFCRIRADSLHAALAEVREKPTAIFMHHPPFEVRESDYPFQFADWESAKRIGRAIDGQMQVAGIFCGHNHRDATGEIGAVAVSSTPSVAVDLQLGRPPTEVHPAPLYKVYRFGEQRGFTSEIRSA